MNTENEIKAATDSRSIDGLVRDPKPSKGWGLYTPEGTLTRIYNKGDMTPEREASILLRAYEEIDPAEYEATPNKSSVQIAKELGWRVLAVSIIP